LRGKPTKKGDERFDDSRKSLWKRTVVNRRKSLTVCGGGGGGSRDMGGEKL